MDAGIEPGTSVPMSKLASTTPPPLLGKYKLIIDMGGPIKDFKAGGHQLSHLQWKKSLQKGFSAEQKLQGIDN